MAFRSGRHFLQLPGPTNVPERILRAMARLTIDHRAPEFGEMGRRILAGLKEVFRASEHVFMYPASGSGSWEAGLVNTLSPGDRGRGFRQRALRGDLGRGGAKHGSHGGCLVLGLA